MIARWLNRSFAAPLPSAGGPSQRRVYDLSCHGVRVDASCGLLQANALTLIPTSRWFEMEGPFPCNPAAVRALEKAGRLGKVTLNALESEGFTKFGWVRPEEKLGKKRVECIMSQHIRSPPKALPEAHRLDSFPGHPLFLEAL